MDKVKGMEQDTQQESESKVDLAEEMDYTEDNSSESEAESVVGICDEKIWIFKKSVGNINLIIYIV